MAPFTCAFHNRPLVIGTRIHLGNASVPPSDEELETTISSFLSTVSCSGAIRAAIAVDPIEKIKGYDLPSTVKSTVEKLRSEIEIDIFPVSPWGKFVPALNALVAWGCTNQAEQILFISAETALTAESIGALRSHMDENTLVAGAALPGHKYHDDEKKSSEVVELDGRTSPWNTVAIWNLSKIALTGFSLLAEGIPMNSNGSLGSIGVEEIPTIAISQSILPKGTALAKLVKVPDVQWQQEWEDEDRKQWHENKMKSKITRASRHLKLLGLSGTVVHC